MTRDKPAAGCSHWAIGRYTIGNTLKPFLGYPVFAITQAYNNIFSAFQVCPVIQVKDLTRRGVLNSLGFIHLMISYWQKDIRQGNYTFWPFADLYVSANKAVLAGSDGKTHPDVFINPLSLLISRKHCEITNGTRASRHFFKTRTVCLRPSVRSETLNNLQCEKCACVIVIVHTTKKSINPLFFLEVLSN